MSEAAANPKVPSWLPITLDFGPLLVFFAVYKLTGVIAGTAAFMIAITVAVIVSKVRLKRVSPMMWISAVLVIVFGGLTIYLRDERFIQVKPTIVYLVLAGILAFGVARGQPLLKFVLEHGYAGLSDRGWMLLSRNWMLFFFAMAGLNEAMRAALSFDSWLTFKVWGVTLLSFVFAAANVPMLMRHGLGDDQAAKAG